MQKSQLIDKALNLHMTENKRKLAIKWCSFNACLLAVLLFDIYKTSHYYDELFLWVESMACFILAVSVVRNLLAFIYYSWFSEKVVCETEEQRILLNLNNSNSLLKIPSQVKSGGGSDLKKQDSLCNDVLTGNIRNLSWQNQSFSEPNSANLSQHASWFSTNNSSIGSFDTTFPVHSDASYSFQAPSRICSKKFIMSKKEMDEFLNDVNEQESRVAKAVEAQSRIAASTFNSFWGSFDVNGFVSSLKNLTYQLSPHSKQSSRDESFSNKDEENSEIIRQMSANKLSNSTTNMKMWIHKTILEPLVNAIDETDKAFEQRGFTDMKIGQVGIERLKKITSSNQQLITYIPTLSKLIPFLDITTNQEFLVKRLRELAKGNCLKNYKFTSGSFDHMSSQMVSDHFPNDSAILFHLFCCYLDSQLQPVPDIPRPFYSRYVIVGDSKKMSVEHIVQEATKNKSKCAILCSNLITPKFNFVTDKIHGSNFDRNNLFYVIIQLLFHLKAEGVLENVSLGKSGLNLINVIED